MSEFPESGFAESEFAESELAESEFAESEFADQEPMRWLDDPSVDAALRADLVFGAGARAGGVDYATSLVALRSAIAAQTGAVAPAAAGGKSVGFKAVVGGALMAGAAFVWALRGDVTSADAPPPSREVDASHDVAAPASRPASAPRAGGPPTATAPAQQAEATSVREPDLTPAPVDAPETAQVTASPEPTAGRPDTDGSQRTESPRRSRPPQGDDDRFLREAKLVAQARKELRDDPTAALASTSRHARDFPAGALVEERRAIGIRALAKLGRADEARSEGADFLREFGDGPHADAVRRVIADDTTAPDVAP